MPEPLEIVALQAAPMIVVAQLRRHQITGQLRNNRARNQEKNHLSGSNPPDHPRPWTETSVRAIPSLLSHWGGYVFSRNMVTLRAL
jgi:hypothetical protein